MVCDIISYHAEQEVWVALTATMFATPMIEEIIPEAMTTRQRGRPRFSMLVAVLFRLPMILKPNTVIVDPRKTKPDSKLSSGQRRAK